MKPRSPVSKKWCRAGIIAWLILAPACGFAQAKAAAPAVADLSVPELARQADGLLIARKHEEAIPCLQEIIRRLTTIDLKGNLSAQQTLEWSRYHLGVAYFEAGQHDKAVKSFDEFLQKHPQAQARKAALLLRVEAHAAVEHWSKVAELLPAVLKEGGLTGDQQLTAQFLLGDALYRIAKWEQALPPLQRVFQQSRNRDNRTRAAVEMVTCYAKLSKTAELFEFLPAVYRTPARYDAGLNMALIEAGDENFDKNRFDYALLLYRLIFTKTELLQQVHAQIAALRRQADALGSLGSLGATERVTQKRALERLIANHQEQLKLLEDMPDYDQDVVFRVARTYAELKRYWEALLLFRSIYEDYPKHRLAQEALYSAFMTALQMQEGERTLAEGYEYVKVYPNGDFWDAVTAMLCQFHVQRQEYGPAILIGQKGLDGNPKHGLRDQLLYLMGYAHFHLEQFDAAKARFTEVIQKHAKSAFREPADYWHALAQLFQSNWAVARREFEAFVARYKEGGYREDAAYRIGVAQYGDNDFAGAAASFRKFIADFPKSTLRADAWAMLGDIAAADTRLDEAQACYDKAIANAAGMIQVNYASFQKARVYELEKRNDEIIKLFEDYLKRYGERGNFTEATYWIGSSHLRAGRPAEAFQTFFDAIVTYGHKPEHYGIDMILRDMISERQRQVDPEQRKQFLDRLLGEAEKARAQGKRTLELRLETLAVETTREPARQKPLVDALLREENVEPAAPITLLVMGRHAALRGNHAYARRLYQRFLDKFSLSDLGVEALRAMAEYHLADGKPDLAVPLLKDILGKFAMFEDAGWAQKTLGDICRGKKQFKEALDAYANVLSVKDWRGPLWPESLYWTGVCHLEQGRTREAFAFFQRVYVLYERYTDWTAKAYVKSAECLEKLGQRVDAVNTYREMLGREALAQSPETAFARKEFQRLNATVEAKTTKTP